MKQVCRASVGAPDAVSCVYVAGSFAFGGTSAYSRRDGCLHVYGVRYTYIHLPPVRLGSTQPSTFLPRPMASTNLKVQASPKPGVAAHLRDLAPARERQDGPIKLGRGELQRGVDRVGVSPHP